MCGIAGFAGFQQDGLIEEMTECIFHRGPDDFGYFKDKDINFGLRRLSIIDIKGGHQPMSTTDGNITIIFNGEIYNYKELRKDLTKKGASFRTHSDTEILLKSYREYGLNCLQKVNGMFAFAIWDKREKKLILARDRLGIKPLYYSIKNDRIIFSSEIKSILKSKDISRKLNYNAIDDFLRLRYIPGEQTMFKEIKLLPPATFLVYKSGNVTTNEFWKLDFSNDRIIDKFNENDIVEEFQDLLMKSIKYRMQSDVPLGVYLSGGLDSSVIAHLVSKNSSEQTKLFSHGYDGVTDELRFARITANYVSGNHEEVMIKEEHFDNLKHIIYHLETPIANSDIIGFDLLARIACPSVKVILAGEGSDELFGSYVHQTTIMKSNVYFNKFVGKNVQNNFDMDYWGLSYKQNFEFLLNNEKKEKYYIWNASETKIEYSLFSLNQSDRLKFIRVNKNEAEYLITNYYLDRQIYNEDFFKKYKILNDIKVDTISVNTIYKKINF